MAFFLNTFNSQCCMGPTNNKKYANKKSMRYDFFVSKVTKFRTLKLLIGV